MQSLRRSTCNNVQFVLHLLTVARRVLDLQLCYRVAHSENQEPLGIVRTCLPTLNGSGLPGKALMKKGRNKRRIPVMVNVHLLISNTDPAIGKGNIILAVCTDFPKNYGGGLQFINHSPFHPERSNFHHVSFFLLPHVSKQCH